MTAVRRRLDRLPELRLWPAPGTVAAPRGGRSAPAGRTFWAVRLGPGQRSPCADQPVGVSPDTGRRRAAATDQAVQPASRRDSRQLQAPRPHDTRHQRPDLRPGHRAHPRLYSARATATRSTSPSAFAQPCSGDPWVAYCALREACPTPFSGFQSLPDDGAVLSLSPERFVQDQPAPGRNPPDQRHPPARPDA